MFSYYNDVEFQDTPLSVAIAPYYSKTNSTMTKALYPFFHPIQSTTPTHECNGNAQGCWCVAQYLETIRFRQPIAWLERQSINKVRVTGVSKLYEKALELDKALGLQTDGKHPSMKSCLDALGKTDPTTYKAYSPVYFKAFECMKYYIDKYGPILLETYYLKSMNPANMSEGQFQVAKSSNALYNDYTKGWIAVGYDEDNLYFRNSWGSSVPYSVKWDWLLSGQVYGFAWYQNQLGNLN